MNVYSRENTYMNDRETAYDWIRLIATVFVVIGHSAYLKVTATYGGVSYAVSPEISDTYYSGLFWIQRVLASWVYTFHMPLFFMLSGAVLALKPLKSFNVFVKSKVKRLLVPYYFYGLLFMLPIKYIGQFYNDELIGKACIGFMTGVEGSHLWFFFALFWCMMVFFIIVKILQMFKLDKLYFVLIFSYSVSLVYSYIPIDFFFFKKGLSYVLYFAIGYCFEKERKKCLKFNVWNTKNMFLCFFLLFGLEIIIIKFHVSRGYFVSLVGCAFTFAMAYLCDKTFKNISNSKIWDLVTRNLFYVYIFHDPLEYLVLRIFFSSDYLNYGGGCIMYLLSRTLFVIIISIMLGECVRLIKNMFAKKKMITANGK